MHPQFVNYIYDKLVTAKQFRKLLFEYYNTPDIYWGQQIYLWLDWK